MGLEIARLLMATSLRSVDRMYQGFSMETGNMSLMDVCRALIPLLVLKMLMATILWAINLQLHNYCCGMTSKSL